MSQRSVRPIVEAAKEPVNAVGLLAVVGAAVLLSNPLIALGGAIAEVGYLLFTPGSNWYLRRLTGRTEKDALKEREAMKKECFPHVRPEVQIRFTALEAARAAIFTQAGGDKDGYREVVRKLDYLLDKFLHFAVKECEFRRYLHSVLEEAMRDRMTDDFKAKGKAAYVTSKSSHFVWNEEPPSEPAEPWCTAIVAEIQKRFDAEIADMNRERTKDVEDLATNAVLDKRIDIIVRRRDYVGQIGRITANLNHQMGLMEDTFGLIGDELRARTPEQILADIDEVVGRTDELSDALDQLSPVSAPTSQQLTAGA